MLSKVKSILKNNHAVYDTVMAGRLFRSQARNVFQRNELSVNPVELATHPDKYILCHWSVSPNFGDAASPIVTEMLSGKKALPLSHNLNVRRLPSYSVVGSVLQFQATSNTEIWGSGFITRERRFTWKPAKIHAVRGPLTRERCLTQGVPCPEVYGDPAVILFDTFQSIPHTSHYKIGIIPHYADAAHPAVQRFMQNDNVKFIDVMRPPVEVARDVQQCDIIVSSSLHGLILADALHIPNRWLGVSDNVLKGGFKFQDYFASVARDEFTPMDVSELSEARVVKEAHLRHTPFSRERLLERCPFNQLFT